MIWHCLEPFDLVGVSNEIFLDESSIAYLIESYKVLYNQAVYVCVCVCEKGYHECREGWP